MLHQLTMYIVNYCSIYIVKYCIILSVILCPHRNDLQGCIHPPSLASLMSKSTSLFLSLREALQDREKEHSSVDQNKNKAETFSL